MFDMPSTALLMLITGLTGIGSLPPYPAPIASARAGQVVDVTPTLQLVVRGGTDRRTLQLAGLAMPTETSAATTARTALWQLVRGEAIRWQPHGDRTVLAFREPDGLCLNLELIRQGAFAADPAAARVLPALAAYEAHARERGVGRWHRPGDSPAGSEAEVYITRTGTRYHRGACPHVRESGRPIPLAEAAARLKPCNRCKPPAPQLSTELSTGRNSPKRATGDP